ncbi:MAG: multiheme c-type cytochrome [Planctomycetota bacterium]
MPAKSDVLFRIKFIIVLIACAAPILVAEFVNTESTYIESDAPPQTAPAASAPAAASASEIFVNLPALPAPAPAVVKPDLLEVRFLLIGEHQGELEPCGCSGGQIGGQARMKTRLESLVQADPNCIILDSGELIKTYSPEGFKKIKAEGEKAILKMESLRGETAASILGDMPISAVGLGLRDLSAGLEDAKLRAMLMQMPADTTKYPTVARTNILTNLSTNGAAPADPIVASSIITTKTAAGESVAVLILSLADQESGLFTNPTAAARAELEKNKGKYQFCAAIFHGVRDRARAYAAAIPDVDLWLVGSGAGSPDTSPETAGGSLLIHAGDRGRNIVKITAARKGNKCSALQYEAIIVGANDPSDAATQAVIDRYRSELAEAKLIEQLKNKRTVDPKMQQYAGSDACQACHPSAYEVWKSSKHAHALEDERFIKRNGAVDPECIKCHVTGWYFDPPAGERSSYAGGGITDRFGRVSCESCHGPSYKHTLQPQVTKPLRDVTCEKCHDHDNSPNFDRLKYWPKIQHFKEK